MRDRLVISCAVLVWWFSAALPRVRAEERWTLQVQAPSELGCATSAELRGWVEARLEREVFSGDAANATQHLEIRFGRSAAESGFRVELVTHARLGNTSGTRSVEAAGASCRALDEVLALILATIVGPADPVALQRTAAVKLPVQPERQARRSQSLPAPAPVALPPPPSAAGPGVELAIGARVHSGLLPVVAFGSDARLSLAWPAFELYAGAAFLPLRSAALPDWGHSRTTAAFGELGACIIAARPWGGRLGVCAGVGAGALWVATDGLYSDASNQEPALFAAPGIRWSVPFSRHWGIAALGGASLPLILQRFTYLGPSETPRTYHRVELGFWLQTSLWLRLGS